MLSRGWRWALGVVYIVAVAAIWIVASYIVQSVVEEGVSPFLITYVCNSLFVVYIPIVEIARYVEDSVSIFSARNNGKTAAYAKQLLDSQKAPLLVEDANAERDGLNWSEIVHEEHLSQFYESERAGQVGRNGNKELDAKGRWTRTRMAKVGLLISPFWFLAQLTFNLSLKYTTVTSNTILSTASSLFTFLVAVAFLGERFTFLKLISVALCMAGTIIVSLGDSATGSSGLTAIATNRLLGDVLAIVSAGLYSVYITLIRKKIPDEDRGEGQASMAQFLGFLGLFNLLIFLPVALILNFTGLEPFHRLGWRQIGLILGKEMQFDYEWEAATCLEASPLGNDPLWSVMRWWGSLNENVAT
ncbi:hypothetical protein ACLOJK_007930 [Asimina triloba]